MFTWQSALLLIVTLMMNVQVFASDRAVVPEDGKIIIMEHGYRDWQTALLHYKLGERQLDTGPSALTDGEGKPVPAQVEGDELLFVARLDKGSIAVFTLGGEQPAESSLSVRQSPDSVEAANEFFALRLPPSGRHSFNPPSDPANVPGPIVAWQPAGGRWAGSTRFVATRKFVSAEFSVLKNGPAVFEYEARYRFEPTGEYVCRIRVSPGIDYADITEEYDFGTHTEGNDFLLLELQEGLEPATVGLGERHAGFEDYINGKIKANANPDAPVGGAGATPMPPKPEPDMVLLEKVFPGGRWGGLQGSFELREDEENAQPANHVAAATMHVGNWRRTLAMTVWHKPQHGVVMALPISTRRARWYAETTDDISPFSTHEHDESLPASYGRRQWALYFGDSPGTLQQTAGYIGLDSYKDWILDWADETEPEDYPRAWFTKDDIETLKESLDRHPDRDTLRRHYLFSGNPQDAIASAQNFIKKIPGQHVYLGNWDVSGLSHYRQSESLRQAYLAEDALACPELPADLRRDVRRVLALSAYLMAHPDLNPRGAGVHLGNNNMSINRSCALAYFAGLLPDHPLYQTWMDNVAGFVDYKLSTQVAWDGSTIECPTYWLYGPLRFLEPAAAIIRNTGGPDLASRHAQSLFYFANLTMPDARFGGRRIIPGMGNSSNRLESIFGSTLSTVLRSKPALAPLMQKMHRASWPTEPLGNAPSNSTWFAFQYRPEAPEAPAELQTTYLPTYGVIFRNHFDNGNETGALFRAGINWSHWDTDDGNIILYGKGAPLSPGTAYQYYSGPAVQNNAIYHNQVKVGSRNASEVFGRVDDAIIDYGFGESVDYAVNSRFRPSQIFNDGKGSMNWNRHVLFLKSETPGGADYFVMRDTFPGGEGRRTWWTWLNLDGAENVTVDGQAFDPENVPFDTVVPEDQMPAKQGRVLELSTKYGAGTWMWFANRQPVTFRARLTFKYPNSGLHALPKDKFPLQGSEETKTIIEASARPGEDYFYVVYPKKDGAEPPACTRVAENVLKITTAESTDFVFVNDTQFSFENDGVVFTGRAGAVRVFGDRVELALNSGSGRIGYNGVIFEGHAPFERSIALAELKPGVTAVTDTYEKKRVSVDIGGGMTVEGEAPFDAKLDGERIVLEVDGRARVLYVTRPDWIWQPWMTIDGEPSMACWTDYPASGWGTYDRANLMGVPVPDGKHTIELTDRVFPTAGPRSFAPTVVLEKAGSP